VARVVAGIGDGGAAPVSAANGGRSTRARSPIARFVPLVVAFAAAVAGILAGREIAYERSLPGLSGALGGIIPVFLLVVAIAGLSLVGGIATLIRHGHVSRAILTLLAAAGMLATGAFGGAATAAATGAIHVEPVVLQTAGEASLKLDAVKLPFASPDHSRAECRSEPDGRTVVELTTSALGELGTGTMLAAVILPDADRRTATARFWIDAADLPDGAAQPLWKGSALILEMRADGTRGRLAFDGLSIHIEDKMPVPDPAWPSAITGELTWSCQPW
jgi:hypothetical protein